VAACPLGRLLRLGGAASRAQGSAGRLGWAAVDVIRRPFHRHFALPRFTAWASHFRGIQLRGVAGHFVYWTEPSCSPPFPLTHLFKKTLMLSQQKSLLPRVAPSRRMQTERIFPSDASW
jgi:hypothetical protein